MRRGIFMQRIDKMEFLYAESLLKFVKELDVEDIPYFYRNWYVVD